VFTAKIVSEAPGPRLGGVIPSPNNWMMELQWDPVEGDTAPFTTDLRAALHCVASKFAAAWLRGGFEGGVFYSGIALSARAAPRPIARSKFFWQEPYHTPSPDTAPGLEDAVTREMLRRMCVPAYAL
jgi:hypothetical protein